MVFYQIIAWMPPSPYFWPSLQVLSPVSTKFYFLSAAPFQILNLSPQPSRWPRQCSLHQVLNGRDKPESCHICKQLLKPSHWSILLNCFHLSALNHNHSVRGERSVEYFEQRHVDHSGRGVLIYLLWSGLASADQSRPRPKSTKPLLVRTKPLLVGGGPKMVRGMRIGFGMIRLFADPSII